MEPTRTPCPCSVSRSAARSERLRALRLLGPAAVLCLATLACESETAKPPATGDPTLASTYVALGDALTAGMVSNALVESHQAHSFPAQIARQAGSAQSFQQPLISRPGIDVELELRRFFPGPVQIIPSDDEPGVPINDDLGGPYNNLGVPGATIADLGVTDGVAGGFHQLVLRDLGSATAQCIRLRPSLVTVWTGNTDILNAVVRGRAIDGVTLTRSADFEEALEEALTALQRGTGATILVANIPDFTTCPFVTSIKPYLVDAATGEPRLSDLGTTIPLIGPTGTPLPASAFVTLAASSLLAEGVGIPESEGGLGTPLPDEVVLDQHEVDVIRERIAAHNLSIGRVCGAALVPVVDMQALFARFVAGIPLGGSDVNATFLTGGIYSYDGVHPTDLGYALIANEWIRAINDAGGEIPIIDLSLIVGLRGGGLPSIEVPRSFEFTRQAYQRLLAIYSRTPAE